MFQTVSPPPPAKKNDRRYPLQLVTENELGHTGPGYLSLRDWMNENSGQRRTIQTSSRRNRHLNTLVESWQTDYAVLRDSGWKDYGERLETESMEL